MLRDVSIFMTKVKSSYTWSNKLASLTVNRSIAEGLLIRPEICSKCGNNQKSIVGHHQSYLEGFWLDVTWLCTKCHWLLHLNESTEEKETRNKTIILIERRHHSGTLSSSEIDTSKLRQPFNQDRQTKKDGLLLKKRINTFFRMTNESVAKIKKPKVIEEVHYEESLIEIMDRDGYLS